MEAWSASQHGWGFQAGRCMAVAVAWCALALTACNSDATGVPVVFVPDTGDVRPPCEGTYCSETLVQRFDLDPFYRKVIGVRQIAVAGSHLVADQALELAAEVVDSMLAGDIRLAPMLVEAEAHVALIGTSERTTDIPEHKFLRGDPTINWDTRARGLGGTPEVPVTSIGEENLLCGETDRWAGENILVHEFAHTLHLVSINGFDFGFDAELDSVFALARAEGLWSGTYADTNSREYFAEGVQTWFNVNQSPQVGIHNSIDTRDELADYDPRLYEILSRFFIESDWVPSCPSGG